MLPECQRVRTELEAGDPSPGSGVAAVEIARPDREVDLRRRVVDLLRRFVLVVLATRGSGIRLRGGWWGSSPAVSA